MGGGLTEDALVEQPALRLLAELGWEVLSGFDETLGPGGTLGRDSQGQVVLVHRLRAALRSLNPGLPDDALTKAIEALTESRAAMDRVRANREIHLLLKDGLKVEADIDGREESRTVQFIDWSDPKANDLLAVSQLWVKGDLYTRRADIVLFVNGIPLVFIELKVSHGNVRHAYDGNLRDYRDTVPELFSFNAFVILSNGADTKVGSTWAPWDHFADWKKIDSEGEVGVISLETALRGTCAPTRLLDLVENFVAYIERPGGLVKAVAKNHQYLGVNSSLDALLAARAEDSSQLGVFWHTQGSGKSLSNLWFTQKVLRKVSGNWTFVEVTDRRELDEQLYGDFADAGVLTSGENVHAETSEHLRQLLGQDHRYVFTLIHKFRPPEAGVEMPVLSARRDVVVITDEAHRSQYDQLAWNMRQALPNASFLGFTGTPLIEREEELTRQVFGDYVSVYNFADSIADGATVPLYYENRIPELQLVNEDFDEDLDELLDEALLDADQEQAVARQFSRQYHLITRAERVDTLARDLVLHFVSRGFRGKAMYVAIDKATAVRMHELVREHWDAHLGELRSRLRMTPPLERPPLKATIEFMETTDMAVVVSQSQNEIADMDELGLDIEPHRRRMNTEDLDSRFKDPDDPFRLVFVCAMWLTGFDAPACSTIYLDKPMRNHTLMQTIARANRVFPDKDSGLIVDYVGVFRNLEKALAIYGASQAADGDSPIQPTASLAADLDLALSETADFLASHDIDLDDLTVASGFEFIALQRSAVEALLIDDATRRAYLSLARRVRALFKSLLPDPVAQEATRRVAVIRTLAAKLESSREAPDISSVMDAVGELLDRSVGAEEYVIRSAGDADPLIDLNRLDFEQLAMRFATSKRTAAKQIEQDLERRLDVAVRHNPTRLELAERFRALIDAYNAGTHNLEEFLRRLKSLNDELTVEEQRTVREGLSAEELAIFDLLTKPDPELTGKERSQVRQTAKQLLVHVTEKLVLDWRKRQHTRAAVLAAVKDVFDEGLPEVYGPDLFDEKCHRVYEHLYASYFDNGGSVYAGDLDRVPTAPVIVAEPPVSSGPAPSSAAAVTDSLVTQAKSDPAVFARLMEELFGTHDTWFQETSDLIAGGETRTVEFKQSARWSLRENQKDRTSELMIVKTVAGFLNASGGTLLIGVRDNGAPVGLDADYPYVKPHDADGFVNWLDTLFDNHLGKAGAHRVQIRIDLIDGHEICRVDVPASSRPIWVRDRSGAEALYARRSNSTRAIAAEEVADFIAERFGRDQVSGH